MFLPWGFVAMNMGIAIYVLICFALPIVLIPLSLMLINAPMFLESKRVSRCRHCGYDLRGSRGSSLCSECGRNPWAEQQ